MASLYFHIFLWHELWPLILHFVAAVGMEDTLNVRVKVSTLCQPKQGSYHADNSCCWAGQVWPKLGIDYNILCHCFLGYNGDIA